MPSGCVGEGVLPGGTVAYLTRQSRHSRCWMTVGEWNILSPEYCLATERNRGAFCFMDDLSHIQKTTQAPCHSVCRTQISQTKKTGLEEGRWQGADFLIFIPFIYSFCIYSFCSMCECFSLMYVCVPNGRLVIQRSQKGIRPLRTGAIDCSEPPCGCWEQNSVPLQEQQMLSTAELPLQAPKMLQRWWGMVANSVHIPKAFGSHLKWVWYVISESIHTPTHTPFFFWICL